MSLAVLLGLCLQATALALLFARLRGAWFRHVGAVFVVIACVFHGLSELLIALFPGHNPYRGFLSGVDVDWFVLSISLAILLLTVVYLAFLRGDRESGDVDRLRSVFNWKVLLLATIPLALWTLQGVGVSAPGEYLGQDSPLSTTQGLATQFLSVALPITGVALVLRFGRGAVFPVLAIQTIVLASVGQRAAVVVVAATFLYAVARIGMAPGRRGLTVLMALTAIVMLVLTSTRANLGRDAFSKGQGASVRLGAVASGIGGLLSHDTVGELERTAGYRLDGNSFGALELASIRQGQQPLGIEPLLNNVKLAVPSALDSNKLDRPVEERSEKYFAQVAFGLPATDILVTQLGGTVGYLGLPSLVLGAILIGFLLAQLDSWLLRRLTPISLIVGVVAMDALLNYGRGLESWTLAFRGLIVIVPVALVVDSWARIKNSTERPISDWASREASSQVRTAARGSP